jgi:hypothetical protein
LFDQLKECSITVVMSENDIDFRVDQFDTGPVQPGVDDNGYIVVSPGT